MKIEDLFDLARKLDADIFGTKRSSDILKYLDGEVEELRQADTALKNGGGFNVKFNQVEEFGDVLFCLIAYAKQNDIDINQALSLNLAKLRDRKKNRFYEQ